MAAATGAMAQSSVELFGIVDVAFASVKVNNGPKNTGLSNSGESSSRLGFRGTEDLGGGLKAGFWLESAINNDDNTTTIAFDRRSTVSLMGDFGEVRLGRDYTPTFWNDTQFDPFGTVGVGTSIISSARGRADRTVASAINPTYTRANNSIGYHLPSNSMGIYGQFMYAFGENAQANGAATNNNNRYVGGRLGYANGPMNVALSYGKRNGPAVLDGTVTTTGGMAVDITSTTLAASYDLGMVKLMGEYAQEKYAYDSNDKDKLKGWLLGAVAPVGNGLIKASYGQVKYDQGGKAKKLALGYVHNLSKRTALYATYARVTNDDNSDLAVSARGLSYGVSTNAGVANETSTGYEFGVRHSF